MKKGDYRQFIRIKGANEHNLKNISVDIPRNCLLYTSDAADEL